MKTSDLLLQFKENVTRTSSDSSVGVESILVLLYDTFWESYREQPEIKKGFRELYSNLEILDPKDQEVVVDIVATLCMEHEKNGFINGVKLGFRLGEELR